MKRKIPSNKINFLCITQANFKYNKNRTEPKHEEAEERNKTRGIISKTEA